MTTGSLGTGVGFLYVVPIAIVAVQLGRTAGVAAGMVALALFAVWSRVDAPDLGFVAYLSRAIVFLSVGAITGHMADRLRRAGETAEENARHFELARDMHCTADFEGYMLNLNESWERTLGWTPEELMSRPFIEFVHPDDREQTVRESALLGEGDFTASFTNRYAHKDGGWRWIEWSSQADPARGLIYAAARDVTERREAEQAQREAEERFRRAFEDSATGMAVVDLERDLLVEANESLSRIVGVPREELVGTQTLAELTAPEDMDALREGLTALRDGDCRVFHTEFRLVRPDGRRIWVDLVSSIVRDDEGRPMYRLSQAVDIDARKQAEERLRYLADHDPLSGVYNRRRFEQELERELGHSAARQSRGAVLLIDVDDFKGINDSLGHAKGDAVISRLGHTLRSRMRTMDVVARLGGDEFAVLVRRVDPEEAAAVARNVRDLATSDLAGLVSSGVTLSIGVAPFGAGDVPTPDDLLSRADRAMYEAKRSGGDRVAG